MIIIIIMITMMMIVNKIKVSNSKVLMTLT